MQPRLPELRRTMFRSRILNTNHDVFILSFFFGCTWDWTQGMRLAKQLLYCFSRSPSPFTVGLFFRKGLTLLSTLALDLNLPTSTSQLTRIISMCHHTLAWVWDQEVLGFEIKSSNLCLWSSWDYRPGRSFISD
jgi:hypothetical protein